MDDIARQPSIDTPEPNGLHRRVTRRSLFQHMGAVGALATTTGSLGALSWVPERVAEASNVKYPDIQFDIGSAIPPARHIDEILMLMPPVYTVFATATIGRSGAPTAHDQKVWKDARSTSRYASKPTTCCSRSGATSWRM
jgi:hypothetical protein